MKRKKFSDFLKWWNEAGKLVLVRGEETPDLDVQYKIAFSMWKENAIGPWEEPGLKDKTTQEDGPEKGPMFDSDDEIPF